MSALPPKADMFSVQIDVRLVPIADMQLLAQPGRLRRLPLILSRLTLLRSRYFHAPCSQPGTLIAKKVLTRRLHIADFFRAFGRTRGVKCAYQLS
jgi:hypothetical protein